MYNILSIMHRMKFYQPSFLDNMYNFLPIKPILLQNFHPAALEAFHHLFQGKLTY